MRAVVSDPEKFHGIGIGILPLPKPSPDEALVRIETVSLNPGELRAPSARPRLGRDLCGVVEQAAANGQGPRSGTRVVGMLPKGGAFAEYAAVPIDNLAQLPESVSMAQAASLPVAGLTALIALERGGLLLGRKVLITGASGGVGLFGVQLAHAAGAVVTAALRSAERSTLVEHAGAKEVIVGAVDPKACPLQSFILDTVGGSAILTWLDLLERRGMLVSINRSIPAGDTLVAPFEYNRFLEREITLQSFYVFDELEGRRISTKLELLVGLVARGELKPHIGREASWADINAQVEALCFKDRFQVRSSCTSTELDVYHRQSNVTDGVDETPAQFIRH